MFELCFILPLYAHSYVPPQDLIEKKNKDNNHADVKVKDVTNNAYFYANTIDHERDIVEVIKMDRRGELKGLPSAGEDGSKACALQ